MFREKYYLFFTYKDNVSVLQILEFLSPREDH